VHKHTRSYSTLDFGDHATDTKACLFFEDAAAVDTVIAELVALRAEMTGASSLVGRLVEDAHDDSPCPVTGKVVGQVDEETVEVPWGERQFEENPGTGTYEPIDALRPARTKVAS